MRLAFISESPSDEAALHAFCEALLACSIEVVAPEVAVRRGWPALKTTLGPALRSLRYRATLDLAIVVVDSDGRELHGDASTNRRKELAEIVRRACAGGAAGARPFRCALGLAAPCIEAWWLAPSQPEINEARWLNRKTETCSYNKQDLKRRLYGTDRPGLPCQTNIMSGAATAAAFHADYLAARFPLGFSPLLQALRALARHD